MRWIYAINDWTNWMIAAGTSIRTIELRRYQMRRLAEAHLRRSPWRITTEDLIEWMSGQPWSTETRRSYRATLRAFYGWAMQSHRSRRNPAADLPAVPAPHTVPRPTPDDVLTAALQTCTDRDRLILSLAAYAGLRRAEIAGLMWADIDLDGPGASYLRVTGKGSRIRVVPLHDELERELWAERIRRGRGERGTGYRYNASCTCGCVFPGQRGGPMTPAAIGKAAARVLGEGWGAHSLRHRFATRVYAGTHDLLAVQELLGHAKPETSRRYTQLSDGKLADAVNAI